MSMKGESEKKMMTHPIKEISIDVTNKCTNQCPACARQTEWDGTELPGNEISLETWEVITDYFDRILMCGQISDPTLHHDFHGLLEIAMKKNVSLNIHTAATYRSKEWYTQAFELTQGYKKIMWFFGIDGLPQDSHKYRVNQDGEKLYEIMKTCAAMGNRTTWQYIPFNYNENDIDTCVQMAQDIGVRFKKVISSRWAGIEHLRPENKSLFIDKKHEKWLLKYHLLRNFYLQNEHTSISEDTELYEWCQKQRRKYRKNLLKEERINLLNQIKFIWESK